MQPNNICLKRNNLPAWATFAPETQTFSGTPTASDLGFTTVTARAYNSANSSSVSENVCLLVANGQSPTTKIPLQSQLGNRAVLASAKYHHAMEGISVPPNWSWSVGLLWNIFVAEHKTGFSPPP
jgi:axial budding pattern protein 2